MADNINVNPTGSTPIATDEIGGVHYQKVMSVNENGDVGSDIGWIAKLLMKVFGRFSFTGSSELRTSVSGSVSVSSGTVTTVSVVTNGYMSVGDSGKLSTIQQNSAIMYGCTNRRNFV